MEGNGHNENESRLDRLEDAWNLMIRDHEEFRAEHKRLLAAQVVMNDRQAKLDLTVQEIGDKLNGLIAWSEQTQHENEIRLREQNETLAALQHKHVNLESTIAALQHKHVDLESTVKEIGDRLNVLIAWSDETRRENEIRFRRLEEKH